jgi:hypothetical protein
VVPADVHTDAALVATLLSRNIDYLVDGVVARLSSPQLAPSAAAAVECIAKHADIKDVALLRVRVCV